MFTLTVSDHVMIAHSLKGTVFGPAQRLHGATYVVELELRRRTLDADGIVADIGRVQALLTTVLAPLAYRNLDDVAVLGGRNTTTEVLAEYIGNGAAQLIRSGALGSGFAGLRVTLRETPSAWASYDMALA